MALYYDLPVFKDVYQMTLRIFQGLSPLSVTQTIYQQQRKLPQGL